MADVTNLPARLGRKPIVVAPGVYDAFTALLAERSGLPRFTSPVRRSLIRGLAGRTSVS